MNYLESDLETVLLDPLQSFLLELGTGFCFEARQKRITIGNEHDYIDLVFYHPVLRCPEQLRQLIETDRAAWQQHYQKVDPSWNRFETPTSATPVQISS